MAGKLVDVIAKFNPFCRSETSVSLKDLEHKLIIVDTKKRKFVQVRPFGGTVTEPGLSVPSPGKVGHTTRVYVP